MTINLNDFAVEVANRESGSLQVDIAQIKEVLKITFELLSERSDEEILEVVNRYRKEKKEAVYEELLNLFK